MKKTLITIFAILGALAAAAALLYLFRDKIKALFDDVKCKYCCSCEEEDFDDFEEAPAVEQASAEEPAEEAAEDPAE